ncbi:hypothetical protein T492DRAFT_1069723, partial [Pavlovales sp. CCMP2436]
MGSISPPSVNRLGSPSAQALTRLNTALCARPGSSPPSSAHSACHTAPSLMGCPARGPSLLPLGPRAHLSGSRMTEASAGPPGHLALPSALRHVARVGLPALAGPASSAHSAGHTAPTLMGCPARGPSLLLLGPRAHLSGSRVTEASTGHPGHPTLGPGRASLLGF